MSQPQKKTGFFRRLFSLSPRRMKAVLVKEFTQLRRDRATFAMIILVPIVQLLLFGYAINSDPKNLPTVIVARDHSSFARRVVSGLVASDYFKIVGEETSDAAAEELLQKGEVQFVVSIPENFERDLVRGDRPSVLIEADATDPMAASGAVGALSGIEARIERSDLVGSLDSLKGSASAFSFVVHRLYNPEGFSRYNIVPGLIGIVLTMTGVMMTALALTRERERGTMENLLSMPVRPLEVMIGKITPYVLIGYVQSLLIVLVSHLFFSVPILGSLWILTAVLGVFMTCNLALGFALSTGARNQTQAMQLSFAVLLPSVLLSGFMFPFLGMPKWAQAIGGLLPATYFMRVARGILLKGASLVELWPSLWPLLLFCFVIGALAMGLYKKTLD